LGYFLREPNVPFLLDVYRKLGANLAYISKYYVTHNDLHVDNVIVEGNKSLIIDWGGAMTGLIPEKEDSSLVDGDSGVLLLSTIERCGDLEIYKRLERVFTEGFLAELWAPLDVSVGEIFRRSLEKYGV
jgi:tRNA A-37 threonylcarbamoyl transferase component Bud32